MSVTGASRETNHSTPVPSSTPSAYPHTSGFLPQFYFSFIPLAWTPFYLYHPLCQMSIEVVDDRASPARLTPRVRYARCDDEEETGECRRKRPRMAEIISMIDPMQLFGRQIFIYLIAFKNSEFLCGSLAPVCKAYNTQVKWLLNAMMPNPEPPIGTLRKKKPNAWQMIHHDGTLWRKKRMYGATDHEIIRMIHRSHEAIDKRPIFCRHGKSLGNRREPCDGCCDDDNTRVMCCSMSLQNGCGTIALERKEYTCVCRDLFCVSCTDDVHSREKSSGIICGKCGVDLIPCEVRRCEHDGCDKELCEHCATVMTCDECGEEYGDETVCSNHCKGTCEDCSDDHASN